MFWRSKDKDISTLFCPMICKMKTWRFCFVCSLSSVVLSLLIPLLCSSKRSGCLHIPFYPASLLLFIGQHDLYKSLSFFPLLPVKYILDERKLCFPNLLYIYTCIHASNSKQELLSHIEKNRSINAFYNYTLLRDPPARVRCSSKSLSPDPDAH